MLVDQLRKNLRTQGQHSLRKGIASRHPAIALQTIGHGLHPLTHNGTANPNRPGAITASLQSTTNPAGKQRSQAGQQTPGPTTSLRGRARKVTQRLQGHQTVHIHHLQGLRVAGAILRLRDRQAGEAAGATLPLQGRAVAAADPVHPLHDLQVEVLQGDVGKD